MYDSSGSCSRSAIDQATATASPISGSSTRTGVLIAILYDDNYDGKVDRREEVPGARPKVEMPTILDNTAESTFGGGSGSAAGSGSGSGTP
jgi:hypothetical protein